MKTTEITLTIEERLLKSLVNRLKAEFPSLKKAGKIEIDGAVATINGLSDEKPGPHSKSEADMMIDDINSIVRSRFEGKIKEVTYAVVGEHKYIQFSVIPETAIVH